jgi:toxin ParE1/3/4
MANYKISKLAELDLEDIWNFTVYEWSVEQAEKYLDGLFSCFDGLSEGYVVGKSIDQVRKGYKKALFGKHNIFYKLSPSGTIEIIRILHVRMDVESRL